MRNEAQIKAAIASLRNNTDNAGQAKRPLYKLALTLTISTLALSAADAGAKTDAAWNFTGSMSVGRFSFTATLLQNGKVLVAGGTIPGNLTTNTAELYDPATGTFTATGSMHQARLGFSATRLQNGKVLVAGGGNDTQVALKTAGLYDPATGTWSTTGNMKEGRQQHSAVLLNDGSVLVTGGNIDRTPLHDGRLRQYNRGVGAI